MTEPPSDAFIPARGKLGQMIFENPGASLAPRLEFFVEIAFKPFSGEDGTLSPILRLNGIVIPGARKWTDLAGLNFTFPYAPKPGSIEGGIHLFHVLNPADVTALSFGPATEKQIRISFDGEIDFEIEADSPWGRVPLAIRDCALEVAPLKVATSIEKRCHADPAAITESIRNLVDLDAYEPIAKVPGGFEFPVKI